MTIQEEMTWEDHKYIGRGRFKRDKRRSYEIRKIGARRKYRKFSKLPPYFLLEGAAGPKPTDQFA